MVEASRRRLLLALALLTLAIIVLSGWGFSRLPLTRVGPAQTPITPAELRSAAATLTIFVAFMFSGVLALGSVLVAAPSISGDIESGIVLAILPRPIRRVELLLGKWLGLLFLVALYAVLASTLELLAIRLTTGYLPPGPVEAVALITFEGGVLMTLTLLLSTRLAPMTGGIIALVGFFVAWMGGIAEGFGRGFNNSTIESIGLTSRLLLPTDGLWRDAVYALQPDFLRTLGRQAAGSPFNAADPQPVSFLVWVAFWLCALLSLSSFSFARRDL